MRKYMMTMLLSVTGASFCFGQIKCNYPPTLEPAGKPKVTTAKEWEKSRRPEILRAFQQEMYGVPPTAKVKTTYEVVEENANALGGKATRRQVRMTFAANGMTHQADLLVYIPNGVKQAPVFVGLNFYGNYATTDDPAIPLARGYVRVPKETNKADESVRGHNARRWPYELAIDNGYAVATMYYGDFYPDNKDGYETSVLPMLYKGSDIPQDQRADAIGAWAWGLSRAMDYFERDKDLDAKRVAVLGHSRLGKTSLWAGASDPRFAIVISNDSGCGGAAQSRCKTGESVERINRVFPHWFTNSFRKYGDNEDALPFDQHMLIALMAPRPAYVASGSDDAHAHPEGEFTAAYLAGDVYQLYGMKPLQDYGKGFPAPNTALLDGDVGYHLREGKHDIVAYDWANFIRFADKYFKK